MNVKRKGGPEDGSGRAEAESRDEEGFSRDSHARVIERKRNGIKQGSCKAPDGGWTMR